MHNDLKLVDAWSNDPILQRKANLEKNFRDGFSWIRSVSSGFLGLNWVRIFRVSGQVWMWVWFC